MIFRTREVTAFMFAVCNFYYFNRWSVLTIGREPYFTIPLKVNSISSNFEEIRWCDSEIISKVQIHRNMNKFETCFMTNKNRSKSVRLCLDKTKFHERYSEKIPIDFELFKNEISFITGQVMKLLFGVWERLSRKGLLIFEVYSTQVYTIE